MSRNQLIRCILVSVFIALIAPFPAMTISVVGQSGEETVLDISQLDSDTMERMGFEDIQNMRTKTVSGTDKLLYSFQHPRFFHFYLESVIAFFIALFPATIVVTYLDSRRNA